jgi:hypothetical protein
VELVRVAAEFLQELDFVICPAGSEDLLGLADLYCI